MKNVKSVFGGRRRKTVFWHNKNIRKIKISCSITNLTEQPNQTENNLT